MSSAVFKPINPFVCGATNHKRSPFSDLNCVKRERIQRIRRVLFEPVDHVETQKFLDSELQKHMVQQSAKWEFDFKRGVPLLSDNPRYAWKKVIPTAETITFAPKRRRSIDCDFDNSHLYPNPDVMVKRIAFDVEPDENRLDVVNSDIEEIPIKIKTSTPVASPNKKQTKITDFMQSTKRPAVFASGSKKLQDDSTLPPPAKTLRQSSYS